MPINRRYILVISRSASRFHRDSRTMVTDQLRKAEIAAVQWLLTARLTRFNGAAWDRWTVMAANSVHSVPRIVSHGNEHGVVWSGYKSGWRD